MTEQPVLFGPKGNLVGVLTRPAGLDIRVGVVFLNAGLIHHVGPGRLYVTFARQLAEQGVTSLRFDHSGIGDSPRTNDERSVLTLHAAEALDAVSYLNRQGVEHVIVFGLCSGAYAARQVAKANAADAIILVNPQDIVPGSDLARQGWTSRYFKKSAFSLKSWRNLLTGKTNYRRLAAVFGGGQNAPASSSPSFDETVETVKEQLNNFVDGGGIIQFVLSERDPSVDELSVFLGRDLRTDPPTEGISATIVKDADHLFMASADKTSLYDEIQAIISSVAQKG